MAERPSCGAIAFVPSRSWLPRAPHSLALVDSDHVSRQRATLHYAVRRRALIYSAVAHGIEVSGEAGDCVQEDSALPPFEPKKVVIAKGKARLFWYDTPTSTWTDFAK